MVFGNSARPLRLTWLTNTVQYSVETGLRGNVFPFVGQHRNNLRGSLRRLTLYVCLSSLGFHVAVSASDVGYGSRSQLHGNRAANCSRSSVFPEVYEPRIPKS
jgi:hypothetical protein